MGNGPDSRTYGRRAPLQWPFKTSPIGLRSPGPAADMQSFLHADPFDGVIALPTSEYPAPGSAAEK
jgi:hypothetical protein